MSKLRGWGLLLSLSLPLLVFFSWSQLGSSTSRINLERYEQLVGSGTDGNTEDLAVFFQKTRRLAVAGDITLRPVPPKSGVKAWSIQADGIYKVEIDAKIDGKPVVLLFVPLVQKTLVRYECVSATSMLHVRKICQQDYLQSVDGIPAQLIANAQAMKNLPPVIDTTGAVIPNGVLTGSAYLAKGGDTSAEILCGAQCVKPLACANERPLLCTKTMDQDNARWQEFRASSSQHRGVNIASAAEVDKICTQSLGEGWGIARAESLGKVTLTGEHWVHDNMSGQNNCWPGKLPL